MSEGSTALLERRITYRHGLTTGVAGCPQGAVLLTRTRKQNQEASAGKNKKLSTAATRTPRDPTKPAAGTELCKEEDINKLMLWKVAKGVDVGLENKRVTCYMNASLQCLAHTAPLANYLQTYQSSHRGAGIDWLEKLSEITKYASSPSRKRMVIYPTAFSANLSRLSPTFRRGRLEDAQEFTSYLIDACHMVQLRAFGDVKSPLVQQTTPIQRIFGGYYLSKITWDKGSELELLRSQKKNKISNEVRSSPPVSETYEAFTVLPLELVGGDLDRCFQHFTKAEPLDGPDKYMTPTEVKVSATKRLTIFKGPRILTLHLKRFISNMWGQTRKHNKFVSFPLVLDITQYCSSPSQACIYDLYGVVVHLGRGLQTGHYVSFVKSSNGMWYLADDESVRQTSESDVLKQHAYLLFYQQRAPPPQNQPDEETLVETNDKQQNGSATLSKRQQALEKKRKASSEAENGILKRHKESNGESKPNGVHSPPASPKVNGITTSPKPTPTPTTATTTPKVSSPTPAVEKPKKKVVKKVVKKKLKKAKKRYESATLNQAMAFEMPKDTEQYWKDVRQEENGDARSNASSDSEAGLVGRNFKEDIQNASENGVQRDGQTTPAADAKQAEVAKEPKAEPNLVQRAAQEVASHKASAHLVASASAKNMTWDGVDHTDRNELLKKQHHVRKKTAREILNIQQDRAMDAGKKQKAPKKAKKGLAAGHTAFQKGSESKESELQTQKREMAEGTYVPKGKSDRAKKKLAMRVRAEKNFN